MSKPLRALLMVMMTTALFFGYLHLFVPDGEKYNFQRLHIFLFNLCSGGTILVYFSEQRRELSIKGMAFLVLALTYAMLAFLHVYLPAILLALALAVLMETIRIKRFQLFPSDLFKASVPVSEKFHQASLLCLSVGLTMSAAVILNNEFLKLVNLPNLKLDSFFLGFSFPLSLITMSVMFSQMEGEEARIYLILKNLGFWTITLGVTIFFVFIVFNRLMPQVFITVMLVSAVIMVFVLYARLGLRIQQKNLLTSGMLFLLVTAVTGILYIVLELTTDYTPEKYRFLLRLHTFASLYGWNLSGLAVICRYKDFPIRLHSRGFILLHWLTVMVLAPLGEYYRVFAVLAPLAYLGILYMILFTSSGPESGNFFKAKEGRI
jgi:hypothetical protein